MKNNSILLSFIKLVNLFAPKFNKKTLNFYEIGFKRDKGYVLFFEDL